MEFEFFLDGYDIPKAFNQALREATKRFFDTSKLQLTLVSVSMAWVHDDGKVREQYWIYKFVGGPR